MLDTPKKHLSSSELSEAINTLSDADWLRLNKIAVIMALKCGIPEEDLLQESFVRALEGTRNCPSDVNVVRFLAGTMMSIASSDAKSFDRHPVFSLQNPKYENGHDHQTDLGDTMPLMTEDAEIARIDLATIQKIIPPLFESDPEPIQLLVMGILEGMEKEELQEFSGLHGTEYSSARRLFRRRIEKAFPGGWTND